MQETQKGEGGRERKDKRRGGGKEGVMKRKRRAARPAAGARRQLTRGLAPACVHLHICAHVYTQALISSTVDVDVHDRR
jgi:hypothetical protein